MESKNPNIVVFDFVSKSKDDKGLHIKYYAADNQINREYWGLTYDQISKGLNKPFVLTDGKTVYGPYGIAHPVLFGLAPYGAFPDYQTELDYSWGHAIGYCSDITQTSEVKVASIQAGNPYDFQDNGIMVTQTITNEKAIEEFDKPDSPIPRSISIGIIGYHKNAEGLYDDYDIFHWAAVPLGLGAYGMKARQVAMCKGSKEMCLPQLRVASVTGAKFCVDTALNNLRSNSSFSSESDKSKLEDSIRLSVNPTGNNEKKSHAPIQVTIKPEFLAKPQDAATNPKPETSTNNAKPENEEMAEIRKQLSSLGKTIVDLQQHDKTRDREIALRKITPQFLFKNQEEYEKAINANLQNEKPIEHIEELYKSEIEKFAMARQLEQKTSNQSFTGLPDGEVAGGVPTGAVNGPEVKIASLSDEQKLKNAKINALFDSFALGGI